MGTSRGGSARCHVRRACARRSRCGKSRRSDDSRCVFTASADFARRFTRVLALRQVDVDTMRAPVRKSTPADAGAGAGENNGGRNFEYCPHCGEPTCRFSVAWSSLDRVPSMPRQAGWLGRASSCSTTTIGSARTPTGLVRTSRVLSGLCLAASLVRTTHLPARWWRAQTGSVVRCVGKERQEWPARRPAQAARHTGGELLFYGL